MKRSVTQLIGVGLIIGAIAAKAAEPPPEVAGKEAASKASATFVRPAVVCADEKAKTFHATWQDCISRSDFDGILSAKKSDWENARIEMGNGIMPWITLALDDAKPYFAVPGGLLHFIIGVGWVNPKEEGTATVSTATTSPSWTVVSSFNFGGWVKNTEGKNVHFIKQFVWVAVPPSVESGKGLSFRATVEASGPPDETGKGAGVITNTYALTVVDPPKPDRAAMLNLWAYTIGEGSDDGKWFGQKADEAIKGLRAFDSVLRSFRSPAVEADKAFLDTLLAHPTYEKRVLQHLKVSSGKK